LLFERLGAPVHYWLTGDEASAPLVVFLHGAGVDHRVWAGQIDAFAATYRVLTLDLRGHGLSRPAGDLSFAGTVDDVLALLDIVQAEKVILIGLSMGGNVAQEVVYRRPGRVAALVCVDCTCNTLVPWWDRVMAPVYGALFGPMLAAYPSQTLLRQIARDSCLRTDGQRYVREAMAPLTKRELTTIMRGLLAALHHEPGYRVLVPELLIHGSDDRLGNIRKVMPKWRARDPNSELVIIPDASHCANMDNPGVFNRTVLDWLGRSLG